MALSRVMYIEDKSESLSGDANIGWIKFSKTGRTMYYKGKAFVKTKSGYKYNCIEVDSNAQYWISGCRQDGNDRLYGENVPVYIDEDARDFYWIEIRKLPHLKHKEVSKKQKEPI